MINSIASFLISGKAKSSPKFIGSVDNPILVRILSALSPHQFLLIRLITWLKLLTSPLYRMGRHIPVVLFVIRVGFSIGKMGR